MSEQIIPENAIDPQHRGYEDEGEPVETVPDEKQKAKVKKGKTFGELKANFSSVFGHGIGKISIILVGVVIITFIALAIRGITNAGKNEPAKVTNVDIPSAPKAQITVDAVNVKEAERRANQAISEADQAQGKGQTYQPDFTPNITPNTNTQEITTQTTQQGGQTANGPVIPPGVTQQANQQNVQVVYPAEQLSAADEQRRQTEMNERKTARDKYVDEIRKSIREQADDLLGKGKDNGIRGNGTYSVANYMPPQKTNTPSGGTSNNTAGVSANTAATAQKKVLFKAGKVVFAEIDAEVNTDDGGEVFATMRGGPYNGAKLIGKIEQAPRNIRLHFTILSPQDDRPTLTINAIAIREEDARQGVADSIDNHTLARYTALFAASTLAGISKAVSQPQGTVVILPNGQTVTQQPELTNKRLGMFALGEVGVNAAAEMRKNFDQPPTYKTEAKRGIGIIFLADVLEK